ESIDVKKDTAPAAPALEAETREQPQASNLLDMAKARIVRRAERQKRRLIREASIGASAKVNRDPFDDDDEDLAPAKTDRDKKFSSMSIFEMPVLPKKQRKVQWACMSFVRVVILLTILTGLYYAFWASPQCEVETQFAVRGSSQGSLNALGLGSLMGTTAE